MGLHCTGDTPQKLPAEGVLEIQDAVGQPRLKEELTLSFSVGLKGAVIIEVIPGKVRHDRRIKGDGLHAPLIQSVGRHLEGYGFRARLS